MSQNRSLDNRISKFQVQALRLVFKDTTTTSSDELLKNTSVIHQRNIQKLAIEKNTSVIHQRNIQKLAIEKNTSVIHQRNIQKLAIEMEKLKHKVAPKLMLELSKESEHSYIL